MKNIRTIKSGDQIAKMRLRNGKEIHNLTVRTFKYIKVDNSCEIIVGRHLKCAKFVELDQWRIDVANDEATMNSAYDRRILENEALRKFNISTKTLIGMQFWELNHKCWVSVERNANTKTDTNNRKSSKNNSIW